MALGQSFYDFGRLSNLKEQRIQHQGVVVVSQQVGLPTDSTGYVGMDLTVGLIAPIIVYPIAGYVEDQHHDSPGKIGGATLTFDNSLSYEGDTGSTPAPMVPTVTAPDHPRTTATITSCAFTNLRNADQGVTGTVNVEMIVDPTNTAVYADPDPILATFEYWNGSGWVAIVATQRWDLAEVFTYTITLPSAPTGTLQVRTTANVVDKLGGYIMAFELLTDGARRFIGTDAFDVTV